MNTNNRYLMMVPSERYSKALIHANRTAGVVNYRKIILKIDIYINSRNDNKL